MVPEVSGQVVVSLPSPWLMSAIKQKNECPVACPLVVCRVWFVRWLSLFHFTLKEINFESTNQPCKYEF
jgi:hypothetical protein